MAARPIENNNVSNTPSIISDVVPNPIDLQINQYINKKYTTPIGTAILKASLKKISNAVLNDKLSYLDDPEADSSRYNWNTTMQCSENRSNNMVADSEKNAFWKKVQNKVRLMKMKI